MDDVSLIAWIVAAGIFLVDLTVRAWFLVYIPKRRKPTAATAWLLLIFTVPVLGTLLFIIIGHSKLSRTRRKKQNAITALFHKYTAALATTGLTSTVSQPYCGTAALAEQLTGLAPTSHNSLQLLSGYDEIINDIVASIHRAKHYIYVEFYILALDTTTEPFFAALEAAKARGVRVYVLFDAWGSRKYPRFTEMQHRLSEVTTSWRKVLPFTVHPSKYNRPDLRNHRKIVVIDNTTAYTGSLNMIDATYHRKDDLSYIELMARVEGPSVNALAAVFASDWYSETDTALTDFIKNSEPSKSGGATVQIVPSGPSYPHQNNLKSFVSLLYTAQTSIAITNPYLVPDESFLAALISAAKRGVHVSILNSEAMDQWMVGHAQRSYYAELLEAGVHIYLYKKPQLVHEKHFTIDNAVAVIGSSNLDIRSFELNLECTLIAYDKPTARTLSERHEALLTKSRKVKLTEWKKRRGWQNLLDSVARLSSSLQ